MRRELTISRLGNQGDGIADTEAGPVYVPFALPGERVDADVEGSRAALTGILAAAPERTEAICRHFGECGGCSVQHLARDAYAEWKRQRISEALSMEGIEAEVDPVRIFGPRSRRRATFAAQKTGGALTLGFRRAQSHDIIDLLECPVLLPALEKAMPGLRALLSELLPPGEVRVLVTACDNGLDVNIDGVKGRLATITPTHGEAAETLGIVRLTLAGDPLISFGAPKIGVAGASVELPPGAFLQAVADAEREMAALVVEAVGKARKVADLYCGLGPFSFALARRASVTAVELDRRLLAALDAGARHAQGLKPIKTLARDLAREPLSPMELKAFDAVVFDPPRAGALQQAKALAKSKVGKVAAVSCNPMSFAKDARVLIDGGFTLGRIVPIDQFVYSAHVELVAAFSRR